MSNNKIVIDKRRHTVEKFYQDAKAAQLYSSLFSSFKYHAKPLKLTANRLTYQYVSGDELKVILKNPDSTKARTAMRSLGSRLSENHKKYSLTNGIYGSICRDRAIISKPSHVFIDSGYYFGNIHGDLNTKNIIVDEDGDIFFIDRLSETGDMMFDFTFVMSLLCNYLENHNRAYLDLVRVFFNSYTHILESPDDFFRSIRNNFINYGQLVARDSTHHSEFPEWTHGSEIADSLIGFNSFTEYLDSLDRYDY